MPRNRLKNFSSPRYRFLATVIDGTRLFSWNTMLTPCRNASAGVLNESPAVEHYLAAGRLGDAGHILVSVDLPAPFSPTSPWISPAQIEIDVLDGGTPRYSLVTLRISMRAVMLLSPIDEVQAQQDRAAALAGQQKPAVDFDALVMP